MRAGPSFLLAFTLLGLLGAAPAPGLTPRLVKDINTVPLAQGSFPQGYATAGGLAFFAADDGESGPELWRTDGTVAGTVRVADACPGECGSSPVVVARAGRSVFFQAFGRGFGPVDLWVSDGSAAGTVRLAGPLLLPEAGRGSLWIDGLGVLYFAANDLAHGAELWRSDGTPAGTFQVSDLRPGAEGSNPSDLTEIGGRLFFSADDGEQGGALWTSDGTTQGTRLVRDPLPGVAAHPGPSLLRAAGSTLYFTAPVSGERDGLWRSDGTAGGTSSFINFASSPSAPAFRDATVLAGRLLFVANEPGKGQELWTSNGTRSGTVPLTRLSPAAPFLPLSPSNARLLPERALGGRMVFRVNDGTNNGAHGVEPWITDGTPGGTRLLRDLCPGPCTGAEGTDDAGLASLAGGDLLFFSGNDGVRGFELWATDGTAAGTRLVRDLCRGSCASLPSPVATGEGKAYFLAGNAFGVLQIWRSDGTPRGTARLTSFQRSASPAGFLLDGAFFFTAEDNAHGRELWRTGGTVETTRLFLDLNLDDFGGSYPTEFREAAGKAWFFADDGDRGFELWASDGTEEGTVLVHEFSPGEGPVSSPNVESAVESGGRLFFLLQLQETSLSLWRSDGTPGSTARLTPPDLQVLDSEPLRAIGSQVFFVAAGVGGSGAGGGEELWASDGTPGGTRQVADLSPGPEGSEPRSLAVFQGRLYFTASVGGSGRELWTSDGTAAGTFLVKDIDPRPGRGSEPRFLTEHAGRLYFPAADEEHGLELWASDGTAAGTNLAVEITPGPDGVFMTHFLSSGSRLFFSGGPASITSQGLWVSDGTPAGTRQVSQKRIHIDPREIGAPGVFNGDLYFASDGDEVLWRSDGTEEGTGPLRNVDGLEIDEPEAFRVFANRLFFTTGQDSVLYQTEGTEETTEVALKLAAPFESAAEPASFELVTAGGRLLFRRWDRLTGSELWSLEDE